jgi:hypothetical protein
LFPFLLIATLIVQCFFFLARVANTFDKGMSPGDRHALLGLVLLSAWDMVLYVNCSCNIIIYYVMGSRYRQTLRTLFRRGRACCYRGGVDETSGRKDIKTASDP